MNLPPISSRKIAKPLVIGLILIFVTIFFTGCAAPPPQSQADAYLARAFVSIREGKAEDAMAAVEKALALEPELLRAYYVRAEVYLAQEKYDAALADLERVIADDPDYLDAYIALGVTYQQVGDLEKTVTNYQKALQLDPDNADWYNNLCWAYGVFNQPEVGLDYCEQAIALRAEPYIHDSRGLVYALLGDYGNAIVDFTIFVNFYAKTYPGQTFAAVEQRKNWIKTMQSGENPFTAEVLESLRTE
jgi:tetratricopeptide (TPR) repeat protein